MTGLEQGAVPFTTVHDASSLTTILFSDFQSGNGIAVTQHKNMQEKSSEIEKCLKLNQQIKVVQ